MIAAAILELRKAQVFLQEHTGPCKPAREEAQRGHERVAALLLVSPQDIQHALSFGFSAFCKFGTI
jgi:hypothetical protein